MNRKRSVYSANVLVYSEDKFAAAGIKKLVELYRPNFRVSHIRSVEEASSVVSTKMRIVIGVSTEGTNLVALQQSIESLRRNNANLPCMLLCDVLNPVLPALLPEIPVLSLHASTSQIYELISCLLSKKSVLPDQLLDPPVLTLRQREVLGLLASGASAQEVSSSLGISLKTTYVHRRDILMRLKICSAYYRGVFTEGAAIKAKTTPVEESVLAF
ncbi:helix-turn-helix transcriptional regulator [Salmonella enterica]